MARNLSTLNNDIQSNGAVVVVQIYILLQKHNTFVIMLSNCP